MFCSKCGKTIPQGSTTCVHCGIEIAEGDFSPAAYIASQPVLGQSETAADTQPRYTRYTRTTYTTMPEENADDVFRRTSYRPVYQEPEQPAEEEAPAQDEAPAQSEPAPEQAKEAAPEPAQPAVEADPSALPDSLKSQPLRKVTLGGISPQMAERMRRQAEEDAAQPEESAPARPKVSGLFSSIGRGARTLVPKRIAAQPEEEFYDEAAEGEEYAEPADDNYDGVYEEDEVFDTSDIEEEEEAPRAPLFSFRRQSAPVSRSAMIVRTVVAAVVILALCLGGFVWLSLETAAKSPITGVTYTLYEQGIAMLEEHTTPVYKKAMADLYAADQTGAGVLTRQTEDQAKMLALLPGTPLANDEDFMETLVSIQATIDIAVTLDVMSGDALDQGASDARWRAIGNAINKLKTTNDATEFGAIASAAVVSATPTPAPTATPSPYSTLTKGMTDNDDVRAMQNRLYELGWFTDVRDGDFGMLTQAAIKQFQQAVGLSVTGIADPETLDAIYAEDAPRTGAKITPAPTPDDGSVTGEALETAVPAAPAQ